MKPISLSLLLSAFSIYSFGQSAPVACNLSGTDQVLHKNGKVKEQWEYKTDKKTKKRTFSIVQEFDANGCATKRIVPAGNGTYNLTEWKYDDKGRLTNYKEGMIAADSSQSYSFSDIYNYTFTGLVSTHKKEIYEGEMSQTVEKWEYSYSEKGERSGTSFTKLLVRKDTISNDEIKYSANGTPVERSVNTYFPKGLSSFKKYNANGLLSEFIRYEKGKIVSHKIISYQYNAQGVLELETATDGVGKTSEKKKYEKDKISYTLMSSKGVVLKKSNEPLTQPDAFPYPALPVAAKQTPAEKEAIDKTTAKEKLDKKKNKVVEHYNGTKLAYTDTFNPAGLLIEKNPAEAGYTVQYEYVFF